MQAWPEPIIDPNMERARKGLRRIVNEVPLEQLPKVAVVGALLLHDITPRGLHRAAWQRPHTHCARFAAACTGLHAAQCAPATPAAPQAARAIKHA
jgi:hypothetical protein